jgi:hypothetical protein
MNSLVSQKVEIRLINSLGQISYSLPLGNVNGQFARTMDISALSNGVYSFVIMTESGSMTRLIEIR